jgi:hypothetical protein
LDTNNIHQSNLHLESPNKLQSQKVSSDANKSSGGAISSQDDLQIENAKSDTPEHPPSTIPNSQIYNPPPPTNTSRRLLTYKRHGGRLNNQLIQFLGAIQHGRVLKRKLIIPDEKVAVEWTGLLDEAFDIWDLSSLKNEYDIDWELGLDFYKERAEKEGLLRSQIPKECVLSKMQLMDLLAGGPEHWKKWDEKCPGEIEDVVDLILCSFVYDQLSSHSKITCPNRHNESRW